MKTTQLTLRCFGEKNNGQWSVVCVDLCLAAQASSLEKAQSKLEAQIKDYLFDAMAGQDKAYAEQLLSRKAPLSLRLKYHFIQAQLHLSLLKDKAKAILFTQTMPLRPC